MTETFNKQDADEAALIIKTINDFLDGGRYLQARDMTALMAAMIESSVHTLAEHTDPDTALQVLSQILLRLAPSCKDGSVTIFHDGNNPLGRVQ